MAIALIVTPATAWAQASDLPIAVAASDTFPAGIGTKAVKDGAVYVDKRGLTLYGMDVRALTGRTGKPFLFCTGACLDSWEPLLAPAGSPVQPTPPGFGGNSRNGPRVAPSGDWTVSEGPQGPQWTYKRVHMVFTRKGDRPGSTAHDGEDVFVWNTLKYIPPAPKISAPLSVQARLVDGAYVLADTQGNLLYTMQTKRCSAACADWQVFPAGMARRGVGAWSVEQGQDYAQWLYHGKPVFKISGTDPAKIPTGGVVLKP
nr:hypothetical protein [Sphingobium boeckii]